MTIFFCAAIVAAGHVLASDTYESILLRYMGYVKPAECMCVFVQILKHIPGTEERAQCERTLFCTVFRVTRCWISLDPCPACVCLL